MEIVTVTNEYDMAGNLVKQTTVTENRPAPVNTVEKDENFLVTFLYDGIERVVADPKIERGAYRYGRGYNALLSGIEVLRNGEQSNQFKHFNLADIRPA